MVNIDEQIEKTQAQIKQLENNRKELMTKKSNQERNARTKRLIERGSILEGVIGNAEGRNTIASATYGAHTEGYKTKAINFTAHSENNCTTAECPSSHAEGDTTTAKGKASHTEGNNTDTPVQVQKNSDSTAILRFMWGMEMADGAYIKNIGAIIISRDMFEAGSMSSPSIVIIREPDIKNGDTFSADHIGIPFEKYDTQYCAIPFVNGTLFTDAMIKGSVNE